MRGSFMVESSKIFSTTGGGEAGPPAILSQNTASYAISVCHVAEGVGFEPTIRFPVYTLSRRAPSTARPPLRLAAPRRWAGETRANRARAESRLRVWCRAVAAPKLPVEEAAGARPRRAAEGSLMTARIR